VLGSLWGRHVVRAWKDGRHLASGGGLLGLWMGLAVSGYALYYVADEEVRNGFSALHVAAGMALPVALAIHIAAAVKARRARG
ncbi:hypothetical protein, partial [Zoogloea sp.]|uniref:hypothetical protein n=1 Tax=Zoogloea sp. TaxID=49181 RepID=UPI00321FC21A